MITLSNIPTLSHMYVFSHIELIKLLVSCIVLCTSSQNTIISNQGKKKIIGSSNILRIIDMRQALFTLELIIRVSLEKSLLCT